MRDKYDKLENANALAVETSNAITQDMNRTRASLQESVTGLANARQALATVSEKVKGKEADIKRLETWAMEDAKDRVARQRVFRGVMKTIGGLMKVVPVVGQPYLGLAGDITAGIGDFNWNDPKGIGAQIEDTLGRIGNATDEFLKENKDFIVKVTKNDQDRNADLTSEIEKAQAAVESKEREIAAEQEKKERGMEKQQNARARGSEKRAERGN